MNCHLPVCVCVCSGWEGTREHAAESVAMSPKDLINSVDFFSRFNQAHRRAESARFLGEVGTCGCRASCHQRCAHADMYITHI